MENEEAIERRRQLRSSLHQLADSPLRAGHAELRDHPPLAAELPRPHERLHPGRQQRLHRMSHKRRQYRRPARSRAHLLEGIHGGSAHALLQGRRSGRLRQEARPLHLLRRCSRNRRVAARKSWASERSPPTCATGRCRPTRGSHRTSVTTATTAGSAAATASSRRAVPSLLRELGPHGFLVLTWDEGASDSGAAAAAQGGQIATVLAGPDVRRGARYGGRSITMGCSARSSRRSACAAWAAPADPQSGRPAARCSRSLPRIRLSRAPESLYRRLARAGTLWLPFAAVTDTLDLDGLTSDTAIGRPGDIRAAALLPSDRMVERSHLEAAASAARARPAEHHRLSQPADARRRRWSRSSRRCRPSACAAGSAAAGASMRWPVSVHPHPRRSRPGCCRTRTCERADRGRWLGSATGSGIARTPRCRCSRVWSLHNHQTAGRAVDLHPLQLAGTQMEFASGEIEGRRCPASRSRCS